MSADSPSLPPVTVFCGFLGAGKTTLLNHLLTQAEGRRWALVVNDVGAINIDARLIEQQAAKQASGGEQRVVELGNGCVCCSIRDELAENIAELCATGNYDHVLVETTGVAEPQGIARLFVQKNPFGRSLAHFARLHGLVTVIDAPQFLREARSALAGGEMRAASLPEPPSAGTRPLFELLVEQVECADLLVVNKCDLATEAELAELEGVLQGLNARAEIVRAERGQVPREVVLDRARFDARETLAAAEWMRALNVAANPSAPGGAFAGRAVLRRLDPAPGRSALVANRDDSRARGVPEYTAKYGLTTFLFQARRPFQQAKLEALFAAGIPGLVRAKGFFWLAERPDEAGFLSVAGGVVRYDWLNYWWAALIESGKARRDELPRALEPLWCDPAGDRRQELVFIGVRLDTNALQAELEKCFS